MATVPKKPPHGVVCAGLVVLSDHNNNISKLFKKECGKKEEDIATNDKGKDKEQEEDMPRIPILHVEFRCTSQRLALTILR
jgi:hypothetical protein